MNKTILIFLCLNFSFVSCLYDTKNSKSEVSIKDNLFSFNVTSKDSDSSSNSGIDVSLNEMTTINIKSGDVVLFKKVNFTFNNHVDGALNFYVEDDNLMCSSPTNLSVMNMPPNGEGLKIYRAGDKFPIFGITLVKIRSTNFVISDFTQLN
tara:strand:+ start:36 stop:488 length:453 start_codon:yes stop_codon:yes gene_type:complete